MPNDLPPWQAVQQQTERWLAAKCFEAMAADLRLFLRLGEERGGQPTAAIMDSRTLQSWPESGARAGYDGAKKRKGSKVHAAVDTLGHLLAVKVTPRQRAGPGAGGGTGAGRAGGHRPERRSILCRPRLHRGGTGGPSRGPRNALGGGQTSRSQRGFVLLPRRWVVERSFAWAARFRRLARDYERLATTLAGYHWLAFATLMLHSLFN
jgi:transposase